MLLQRMLLENKVYASADSPRETNRSTPRESCRSKRLATRTCPTDCAA